MNIKKASKDDIPAIQAISAIAWPETFKDILSAEQIRYMMNMMYSTASLENQIDRLNHCYLLAKKEDQYLGYLSYELNFQGSKETKIHKIYVLPEAQGQGVGQTLIAYTENISRNHNNSALLLNVNRHNNAINFYKKTGFDITTEEVIDIGNGFVMDDYVMRKWV